MAVEEDDDDDDNDDQATENVVQVVGSGIIEVTPGANDGEEDDDDEDEDNSYNTDIEPYTTVLGDGDSITVNS